MARPTPLPTALLSRAQAEAGEELRLQPVERGREASPVRLARGRTRVAHLALDPHGAARLHREAAARAWAAAAGVPVPDVVAAGPGWLVSTRVPEHPLDVDGARAVVTALRGLPGAPPPPLRAAGSTWSGPAPVGRPLRALRAVTGRVPARAFRAARAACAALPHDVPAHGDLHDGNVLWDAPARAVRLVDWEYAGCYPAGWDLLTLWANASDDAAAVVLRDAAVAQAGEGVAAVVARWLALRHLGDLVTGTPRRGRDRAVLARARQRVREAHAVA